MQEINYKQIEKELMEKMQSRDYQDDFPKFADKNRYIDAIVAQKGDGELQSFLNDMQIHAQISEYPSTFGSGLKGLIKKITVKMVRFYVLPIVVKQNMYNEATTQAMLKLEEQNRMYQEVVESLNNEIKTLKKEVNDLKNIDTQDNTVSE